MLNKEQQSYLRNNRNVRSFFREKVNSLMSPYFPLKTKLGIEIVVVDFEVPLREDDMTPTIKQTIQKKGSCESNGTTTQQCHQPPLYYNASGSMFYRTDDSQETTLYIV